MKLNIIDSSWNAIAAKLRRAKEKDFGARGSIKFNWIINLLNIYTDGVISVMGSVDAAGGYPRINFIGLDGGSGVGADQWNALSAYTVHHRSGGNMEDTSGYNKSYDALKWNMKIWKDTGLTIENMQSTRGLISTTGFAGIPSSSPFHKYAKKVEEGGVSAWGNKFAARPLFKAANFIFIHALRQIIYKDSTHPMAEALRTEVIAKIFKEWGSGKTYSSKLPGSENNRDNWRVREFITNFHDSPNFGTGNSSTH